MYTVSPVVVVVVVVIVAALLFVVGNEFLLYQYKHTLCYRPLWVSRLMLTAVDILCFSKVIPITVSPIYTTHHPEN